MQQENMTEKLKKYLQIETHSFVVLGDFLPSIYHPSWLRMKDIISEQDEASTQVEEINKTVCSFNIGGWLDFVATTGRMQLLTRQQPYFPVLNDLAKGIFKTINNTVIRAIGINFTYSLKMPNEDVYYKIGANMAGLEKWKGVFPSPVLSKITLLQKDDEKGFQFHVKVTPSSTQFKIDHGVDVAINNHKDFNNIDGSELALFLDEQLDYCHSNAINITEKILDTFVDI